MLLTGNKCTHGKKTLVQGEGPSSTGANTPSAWQREVRADRLLMEEPTRGLGLCVSWDPDPRSTWLPQLPPQASWTPSAWRGGGC